MPDMSSVLEFAARRQLERILELQEELKQVHSPHPLVGMVTRTDEGVSYSDEYRRFFKVKQDENPSRYLDNYEDQLKRSVECWTPKE